MKNQVSISSSGVDVNANLLPDAMGIHSIGGNISIYIETLLFLHPVKISRNVDCCVSDVGSALGPPGLPPAPPLPARLQRPRG